MVMRRPTLLAALSLVIIALGVLVAGPTLGATLSVSDGDILRVRNLEITRIEIEQGDLLTILEKATDGWNVLAPVNDRADESAVNDLIRRLSRLTIADELSGDHPQFGLNPPKAVIRVTTSDGSVRELHIGNLRSPVSLFVKNPAEETVYAVSNVTLANIGEYPMGFVDGTLLKVDAPERITGVQVKQVPADDEEEPVDFVVRREGDGWTFGTGEVAFDVADFFRAAKLIQATGRLADDEELRGSFYPAPGTAQVTIEEANGERTVVDIGVKSADGHHYFVKVSGRDDIYLVPGFHAEHFVQMATSINTSLLGFDYDFVKEVRVKVGAEGSELVYTKNNSGVWEANRSVVFGFMPLLDAIAGVGANRFASTNQDDPAFGFGQGDDAIEVQLTFQDNNTLGLSTGATTDGGAGVYLRTTKRPGVYVGSSEDTQEIVRATQGIRTQLFPVQINQVASVRIQRDADDFTIENQGGRWVSGGREVPTQSVQKLISDLNGLSADSLPPIPEDESELGFYPAQGGIRVTVTFDDGLERSAEIGAGVQVGSGWFATTSYYVAISDLDDVVAFVREQSVRTINSDIDALK